MSKPEDEVKVYDQLCTSYRSIDEFRAKLLGFLPLVTGAGISLLLDKLQAAQTIPSETKNLFTAVGVFGALVTLGLFAYEVYGIKKCAALIQAGRNIEAMMLVDQGQFAKRPQNIAHIINEPFAAGVIYPSVLAAWTYFALAFGWPGANPWIPIFVLIVGFAGTVIYDFRLRKTYGPATQVVDGK